MAIITVISFKGGVGKSVVSQNLAVYFATQKKEVCIVDADPNKSTTFWHGMRPDDLGRVDVYHVPKGGDLIKTVNSVNRKYDIVIIDCPPAIEKLTSAAVAKSDLSLIPVATTGGSDIWATKEFLEHLQLLRARLNATLPSYFVINKYEKNIKLHQAYMQVIGEYCEDYDINQLNSYFAKRTAYGEANAQGLGVLEWENIKAQQEVTALGEEINSILETRPQEV